MLKHYLTTALRHFRRHKLTTAINVVGMSLGLTCFVCAWGVVAYFGQMDRHHEKWARTYFIANEVPQPRITMPVTPWILAKYLRSDFPQLDAVARAVPANAIPLIVNGQSMNVAVSYADSEFLRIFDLPIVRGDPRGALNAPHSAVLKRALAQRLFGTQNVIGRTLRFAGRQDTVTITALSDEIDYPSHMSGAMTTLNFEALLSMDAYVDMLRSMAPEVASRALDRWVTNSCFTYAVLPANGSLTAADFERQLELFKERHVSTAQERERHFRVRPITQFAPVVLDAMTSADRTGVSSLLIIRMLGALVLLVSCLNYVNLATAQVSTRAGEVALRKVVGANRSALAFQYLFESALLTMAALLLCLTLLSLVALSAGAQTLTHLGGLFGGMPGSWIGLAALIVVVTLVAGFYPALVLSRIRPAHALRGTRAGRTSRVSSTVLIGLQFGAASFLAVAVLVMLSQNRDIRRGILSDPNEVQLLISNDARASGVDTSVLRSRVQSLRGVVSVSGVQRMPWGVGGAADTFTAAADASIKPVVATEDVVDEGFFRAMQITLLAGRSFAADEADDVADLRAWQRVEGSASPEFNAVVNVDLAKALGFRTPEEAVGQTIYHPTGANGGAPQRVRIIGVVAESNLRPMTFGVAAGVYLFNPSAAAITVVRLQKRDLPTTLASVKSVWKELAPEIPATLVFGDEQFERSYSFLTAFSAALAFLACLASVIAALGLVGMALHIVSRRMHEIGIRKTLGASAGQILWMLLRNFSKPIVIANLAACPLAYLTMRVYLSMFAHSAGVGWTPFAVTLGATLSLAWLAVIGQGINASRRNPATVLRYE